jgi:hypothetical protein
MDPSISTRPRIALPDRPRFDYPAKIPLIVPSSLVVHDSHPWPPGFANPDVLTVINPINLTKLAARATADGSDNRSSTSAGIELGVSVSADVDRHVDPGACKCWGSSAEGDRYRDE